MHDSHPLSAEKIKLLGDKIIQEQHFTTSDFVETEVILMQVLDFEIGTSNTAFSFLEELLMQLKGVAKVGERVNFDACMDIMDLLYEQEETSILYSSPCSLAASILVASYVITVPKQKWEFPLLPWGSDQSVDWRYSACKPRNCGKGPNISYLFQIIEEGSSVNFCGYPGFEVKCENNTPIYATFRLVNSDVMNLSSSCRVPHSDFAFDRSSLDFGPNSVNLYLFYNCSNRFPQEYVRNPITCLRNTNFNLYNSFAVLSTLKDDFNWSAMPCESYVYMHPLNWTGIKQMKKE